MTFLEFLFFVARHVMPVSVHWEHQFAVVSRPVELRVVGRRIPGFMGVPGVYIEEKVFFVVMFQPLNGGHEGSGGIPVGLVMPSSADVQGFVVVAGLRDQGPHGVLAPVEEKGLKPPVVVHPVPQVVGGVDRRRRVKAAFSQHLRQGGHPLRQRLPPHKGHGPSPRLMVGAGGHSRKSGGIVAVKPDRPGRQGIKRRRSNRPIAVCAKVIPAEGVGNYPNDIHFGRSNDLPRQMCRNSRDSGR